MKQIISTVLLVLRLQLLLIISLLHQLKIFLTHSQHLALRVQKDPMPKPDCLISSRNTAISYADFHCWQGLCMVVLRGLTMVVGLEVMIYFKGRSYIILQGTSLKRTPCGFSMQGKGSQVQSFTCMGPTSDRISVQMLPYNLI